MGAEEIDFEEDSAPFAPNRYLLDTSTVIWATAEPQRLSRVASVIWHDPGRVVAVSVINYWEMALKKEKLGIGDVAWFWEHRVLPYVDIEPLPIREEHVTEMLLLPKLHTDPFDRMLIAQARVENMPLVTSDKQIQAYDVRTVW
jgi:PIN domain nuclease of toxin-antitoxin system